MEQHIEEPRRAVKSAPAIFSQASPEHLSQVARLKVGHRGRRCVCFGADIILGDSREVVADGAVESKIRSCRTHSHMQSRMLESSPSTDVAMAAGAFSRQIASVSLLRSPFL